MKSVKLPHYATLSYERQNTGTAMSYKIIGCYYDKRIILDERLSKKSDGNMKEKSAVENLQWRVSMIWAGNTQCMQIQ